MLAAAGEIDVNGGKLGVYLCKRCQCKSQLDDVEIDVALMFAAGTDGRILDAESLKPLELASVRRRDARKRTRVAFTKKL
jgi:hypothetical protein